MSHCGPPIEIAYCPEHNPKMIVAAGYKIGSNTLHGDHADHVDPAADVACSIIPNIDECIPTSYPHTMADTVTVVNDQDEWMTKLQDFYVP